MPNLDYYGKAQTGWSEDYYATRHAEMIVRLMKMQPILTQVGKILQYYGTRQQHMSSTTPL